MTDPTQTDPSIALVRRAIDGDTKAMRQLVRELTPAIRAGVGSVLARGQAFGRRAARQEIAAVFRERREREARQRAEAEASL